MEHERYIAVKTLGELYGFTEKASEKLIKQYENQSEIEDLYEFIRTKMSVSSRL